MNGKYAVTTPDGDVHNIDCYCSQEALERVSDMTGICPNGLSVSLAQPPFTNLDSICNIVSVQAQPLSFEESMNR